MAPPLFDARHGAWSTTVSKQVPSRKRYISTETRPPPTHWTHKPGTSFIDELEATDIHKYLGVSSYDNAPDTSPTGILATDKIQARLFQVKLHTLEGKASVTILNTLVLTAGLWNPLQSIADIQKLYNLDRLIIMLLKKSTGLGDRDSKHLLFTNEKVFGLGGCW